MTSISEHHQRAIDRLINEYENDKRFDALIVGGSVAKGCAREDSDVDFLIVATEEEFFRRDKEGDLFINRTDLCDYPGGYVDGKVINRTFLEKLAIKGNEPSRAAFIGAFIAFSHVGKLNDLLQEIPVYPVDDQQRRLKAFYAMAFIQQWLMNEADRHGNRYTMLRAATQLVLYCGRTILAHNRILYPYHKWFTDAVERARDKPANFERKMDRLLESPSAKTAAVLFNSLKEYNNWGISDLEAYTWFMREVEWSWMRGASPLEDW